MNKKIKLLAWLFVVVWMGVIFYLSHQPAVESAELSSGITRAIINFIQSIGQGLNMDVGSLEFYVRKNAHFFAYFILGVLALFALKKSAVSRSPLVAFLICMLYAMSDEIHQLFVLGRSAQIRDVLIDSTGAALGILLYVLVSRAIRKSDKRLV